METARAMEGEQRRGKWRGPLHGIPVALKDNIDTAGVHTTAASELFKDRVPPEDAEVVRRLKNAGAVLLGKTNLHEFGWAERRRSATSGRCTTPGRSTGFRADHRADRAPPQPPVCVSDRWEPTQPDQFEFPPATAGLSGSGPRTAG